VDNATYQAGAARVYYRDDNNALVTNLYLAGADPDSFLGVSPYPGAYSNNGSPGSNNNAPGAADGSPPPIDGNNYVATRSTAPFTTMTAYLAINNAPPVASANSVTVTANHLGLGYSATSAIQGISVTGCQDSTGSNVCTLFPIATGQPALYLDTANGVQIGMLTSAPAVSSASKLPLVQTAGTSDHVVSASSLAVTNDTVAVLSETANFLQADYIDSYLVTHGILYTVPPVQVG
jgi:hypothetical protein